MKGKAHSRSTEVQLGGVLQLKDNSDLQVTGLGGGGLDYAVSVDSGGTVKLGDSTKLTA